MTLDEYNSVKAQLETARAQLEQAHAAIGGLEQQLADLEAAKARLEQELEEAVGWWLGGRSGGFFLVGGMGVCRFVCGSRCCELRARSRRHTHASLRPGRARLPDAAPTTTPVLRYGCAQKREAADTRNKARTAINKFKQEAAAGNAAAAELAAARCVRLPGQKLPGCQHVCAV